MKRLLLLLLFVNICFADTGKRERPQIKRRAVEGQHLSEQERVFAKKLSPLHRSLFCCHFSSVQRIEAMVLADSLVQHIKTREVSPDEAIETIMKNARVKAPPKVEPPKKSYSYTKKASAPDM